MCTTGRRRISSRSGSVVGSAHALVLRSTGFTAGRGGPRRAQRPSTSSRAPRGHRWPGRRCPWDDPRQRRQHGIALVGLHQPGPADLPGVQKAAGLQAGDLGLGSGERQTEMRGKFGDRPFARRVAQECAESPSRRARSQARGQRRRLTTYNRKKSPDDALFRCLDAVEHGFGPSRFGEQSGGGPVRQGEPVPGAHPHRTTRARHRLAEHPRAANPRKAPGTGSWAHAVGGCPDDVEFADFLRAYRADGERRGRSTAVR